MKRKEPDATIRLAIVGYRYFNDYSTLCRVVDERIKLGSVPGEIISGGCIGADTLAERYAKQHNIKLTVFKPTNKSNAAFAARDRLIALRCTHMVAFPSHKGKGTQLTIKFAQEFNKVVHVHWVD